MNILIRFKQWDRTPDLNRKPYIRFSWEKIFTHQDRDESVLELALGYMYTLILLRPHNATISFIYNKIKYKHTDFLQYRHMRNRILGSNKSQPKLLETLNHYIHRVHSHIPTMNYIIVITRTKHDKTPVDIIQFNNLTFLQGFISVLAGFGLGTINHLMTIYDKNELEYTLTH
jgi:hypothetical protein